MSFFYRYYYYYYWFLNILAIPNNAVFCIVPTLFVIRSFSVYPPNSFVTLPRTPITAGTASTIFSLHNLPISLFKSSYFSTFSLSFTPTFTSAGIAILLFKMLLPELNVQWLSMRPFYMEPPN